MKLSKVTLLIWGTVFITTGVLYTRYQSAPLKRLYQPLDILNQEFISFDYKILNSKDCKKYFNSARIIKKGYQPVHIIFTNNSKHSIALTLESFSFRCAHAQDVANSLHRDGVARGIGFGIGSLFFLPLIIPAFVQGFGAVAYNEQMDIDFENKAFKSQVVQPYMSVDGVVFASRDQFTFDFTMIVKDIDHQQSFILSSSKLQLIV